MGGVRCEVMSKEKIEVTRWHFECIYTEDTGTWHWAWWKYVDARPTQHGRIRFDSLSDCLNDARAAGCTAPPPDAFILEAG